jgi:NAD(P)-dependent dehydrogenase (short-subunit alcohol dehydrogenase family)
LPFGTPDKTVDRATVDPRRRLPEILFAMAWKPCSFCRGIGINFAVEFVFFLPWNPCSLWRGIFSLDIAVNNAGKETLGMVTDVTGEAFGEVFKTNVLGTLLERVRHFFVGPGILAR